MNNTHPIFVALGPTETSAREVVGAVGTPGDQLIVGALWTTGVHSVLAVVGAATTGGTTTVEQTDVYLNLGRTVTWATGAITTQRAVRITAPTYAFVGASVVTNAATFYINAAPTAGANATLTNAYAVWVDAGRARFDGPVVQNDYPVVQSTGTIGAPVTTINTPAGITVVASGATSVTVTCAACTTASLPTGTILNATTNNVSLRAIIPGNGSYVVHVSADPGVSTAIIHVELKQPGTGV